MKTTTLVVATTLLVACGGQGPPDGAAPADPAAPPTSVSTSSSSPGATGGATLDVALQGLMAVSEGRITEAEQEREVLWAWMIDTRNPTTTNKPPCVTGTIDPSLYPLHEPALFVAGGRITDENGADVGNMVDLTEEDVVIHTGDEAAASMSLAALVSGDEFQSLGLDPALALGEAKPELTAAVPGQVAPPLVTRVRFQGGFRAEARANTCAGMESWFVMVDKAKCDSAAPGVALGEEVRLTQANVSAVRVELTKRGTTTTRRLTITPTGPQLAIAVRNVMKRHHPDEVDLRTVPLDYCEAIGHHLDTYRWFYALTADPNPSCLVPCVTTRSVSGGFKCPIPNPGGP
jgi:hypothetical protein